MNFHYRVLWYLGSKTVIDKQIFDSSTEAENYAENKLLGKLRRDYAYKVVCLN